MRALMLCLILAAAIVAGASCGDGSFAITVPRPIVCDTVTRRIPGPVLPTDSITVVEIGCHALGDTVRVPFPGGRQ